MRLTVALGVLGLMLSLEVLRPKRRYQHPRKLRWPTNLGLAVVNMLAVRFSVGGLAYLSAFQAQTQQWGLWNYLELPELANIIISLACLDFAIYAQHIAAHRWQWLWRLHQVHHTDLEFDATTAVRFHPLEILLSLLYKVAWIVMLGASPAAVLLFEIILNACATFNHSNVDIPKPLEKALRLVLITPDLHRIHHSVEFKELNSNYGFSVSFWDRIFRTLRPSAQRSQTEIQIGLADYQDLTQLGLTRLLSLPFRRRT